MNPPSASLRFVLLGLAALLAIAAWCGYWFYVARETRAMAGALEARLAEDGIAVGCGNRSWGGFPFRIVMRCEPFSVPIPAAGVVLALPRVEFLAQAYDLRHIIAVAASPGTLRRPTGASSELRFGSAVASYVGGKNDEIAVQIDRLASTAPLSVEQINLHLKWTDSSASQLEYALAGHNATFAIADYGSDRIDRLSARGTLAAPSLKSWRVEDAAIAVHSLELASGEVVARGEGRIGFDSSARPAGSIALDIVNLRPLLARLAERGIVPPDEVEAGLALLNLLGKGDAGTTRIDLRAERGRLYFGPFRLGEIPAFR